MKGPMRVMMIAGSPRPSPTHKAILSLWESSRDGSPVVVPVEDGAVEICELDVDVVLCNCH
jgi:hypothetical protein